jgi:hypothetical protein
LPNPIPCEDVVTFEKRLICWLRYQRLSRWARLNARDGVVLITNVGQVGFKIFLNISPTVTNWTSDSKQFSLVFEENPLADFVELPDDGRAQDELWYSNIFCGVLRGALEMVQMQVEAHFISDVLRGNDTTEMRVSLIRYIDDELPPEDD